MEQSMECLTTHKKSSSKLSLDELYDEIHSGETPETKPAKCNQWVLGWQEKGDSK